MEILTIEEYAGLRGISVQAVYNRIWLNKPLEGVNWQKIGKGYVLTGSKKNIEKKIKKKL